MVSKRSVLEILEETFESGRVVANAYRLERVVGKGGMGVVWAAREIAGDRAVALKFLRGDDGDAKSRERFFREARAAMTIAHPNVAKVEAILETDTGTPFLVMELLEGESLRARLRREGALPPVEAARILVPVVDAVAAAHERRLVHRDLKPENIFLVRGDGVRVLDFGIAKRFAGPDDATRSASLTSTGALVGTPAYMAPEQIFGEEVDPRADVWALGVILYECLAAKRPTDADGLGPMIKRITLDPLEPLDHARPGLSTALVRLVGRMLTRKRTERPTLAEVRAVLTALDEGAPTVEHVPNTVRMPAHVSRPIATPPSRVPIAIAVACAGATSIATAVVVAPRVQRSIFAPEPTVSVSITPIASTMHLFGDAGVEGALEEPRAWSEADAALRRRDGATCLERLDRYDVLAARLEGNDKPSTDPSKANLRAQCLMLVGRCNEGRDLYRAYLRTFWTPERIEEDVERVVADECAGDEATPREALLRAGKRLDDASNGTPRPIASQCEQWYGALASLRTTVPPRDDADPIETYVKRADDLGTACFAQAGDCASALRVFSAAAKKKGTSAASVRKAYENVVTLTPCHGLP